MDIIKNTVTGDEIRIIRSSLNNPQGTFELETTLQPKSYWPKSPHFHPNAQETFKVIEGELNMYHEGKERILTTSDEIVVVKPNEVHCFWNDNDKKVTFKSIISPVGNIEKAIRATYILGSAGRMGANNLPRNIFELALLGIWVDGYTTKIPVAIQRLGLSILVFLAKLLGYHKRFYETIGFS